MQISGSKGMIGPISVRGLPSAENVSSNEFGRGGAGAHMQHSKGIPSFLVYHLRNDKSCVWDAAASISASGVPRTNLCRPSTNCIKSWIALFLSSGFKIQFYGSVFIGTLNHLVLQRCELFAFLKKSV